MVPYAFTDQAQTRGILLGVNVLGYVSQAYPGWSSFSSTFRAQWRRLQELVEIERPTKMSVRYVNRFSRASESLRRDGGPAFLAPLRLQPRMYRGVTAFATALGHDAVVQVDQPEGDEPTTITFDVSTTDVPTKDDVASILDVLHDDVETLFEACIEPAFARALKQSPGGT